MSKPYPWYYAVNDRPVKIVLLPNGGADCLVFDFATGDFAVDRSYFSRTLETGIGKDVDQLTEEEFERLVAWQREATFRQRRETAIQWEFADDDGPGYRADYRGRRYILRINPPDRPIYTLIVDGQEVEQLQRWPTAWTIRGTQGDSTVDTSQSGPSIDPYLLRKWAEQLCRTTSDDPAEIVLALGIEGQVTKQWGSGNTVEPPEGTTSFTLFEHPGDFVYIEATLSGRTLTRAQLDACFGEGQDVPRVHPFTPYSIAYNVEVPGAPFTCKVFPSFHDEPAPAAVAHMVLLRRDKVWVAGGEA